MGKRRKKRLINFLLKALWALAMVCFLASATVLLAYQWRTGSDKKKMTALAEPMQVALQKAEQGDTMNVQQAAEELTQKNDDMVGWVSVPSTSLSYPVMHTVQEPEFYLRRGFDKEYSLSGTPFLDAACPAEGGGGNSIIYGHNMKNKTMFSLLAQYLDPAFVQQHPTVRYDTAASTGSYMVFAVLQVDTAATNPNALAGYQTLQGADEAAYSNYITYLKSNSVYASSVTPVYGDTLLTLSTCDNITDTGRILVCAKKVSG